jgi:hypothetical protein
MEGRTSFVMGEGLWYRRGLVYKDRGEGTLNPRGVLEGKVVGIGIWGRMRGFEGKH